VQHAAHRLVLLQPARDLERARLVAREPHVERAESADREEEVVGARVLPEVARGVAQPRPPRLVRDDGAGSRSEWPPGYFVATCITRSAPCSNDGKFAPVAQVLSWITAAPRARATRAIAGKSWISKVFDPGLSR
jgi:hypothetical protein